MNYFAFLTTMIGTYVPERENAWEENVRIFLASNVEEASLKAEESASHDETTYVTIDGFELTWKVDSIRFIKELPSSQLDGEEIFSRSLSNQEARSLKNKLD